jgi:hypothetical protein
MLRTRTPMIVLLALCLTGIACQKLTSGEAEIPYVADDVLAVEDGPYSDAIPAEYGRLVDASFLPSRPRIAFLWFEDLEGNLTVVRLDLDGRKVIKDAMRIPRR